MSFHFQGKANEIAKHFNDKYQANIEKIIMTIRNGLSNLLSGVDILQKCLSTLLARYTQFESMFRKYSESKSLPVSGVITVGKLTHHINKCKLI